VAEEIAFLAAIREAETDIQARENSLQRRDEGTDRPMERKIVWTERASSDVEAIVRYVSVAIQVPLKRSDSRYSIEFRFFCRIRRLDLFWITSRPAAGASWSIGVGKLFTLFDTVQPLLEQFGLRRWERWIGIPPFD